MLDWTEILGYIASVLVLISLTMSSVVRLRVLNLLGAVAFTAYGWLVGALPVLAVNALISVVNIVFLIRMLPGRSEAFELLPLDRPDNRYLGRFLEFHHKDIQRFFPGFTGDLPEDARVIFILRDMLPVGVLVCRRTDPQTLEVLLDYVTASHRDFQCARHFYRSWSDVIERGSVRRFVAKAQVGLHRRYLEKMGYTADPTEGPDTFVRPA